MPQTKAKEKKKLLKGTFIFILFILCLISIPVAVSLGPVKIPVKEAAKAIFVADDSSARLLIWSLRLPRVLSAGLVGICLSLAGCILQGVMRNNLASPSTIGVTSGASFVGYLVLVAFPHYFYLLPMGAILGAFATTLLIYFLSYQNGVSAVKMILSGLAVSAVFSAFNDMIKIFFAESIGNATSFLVGGLNGVVWGNFIMVLPYAVCGILICILIPTRMNILMLGDEAANSLGLRTERFRFFLIVISSLLAGASIAVSGMIGFVGLIVPHISRLLIGSDYKYLFPASICCGFLLLVICDTIGRIILPVGEIPVSITLSFIGAPFFLYLLRTKEK